jgi:sortase A
VSRRLLLVTGEILVTVSLLVFLYLIYHAWFTNVSASVKTESLAVQIEQDFEELSKTPISISEPIRTARVESVAVETIGLVYIPRLKSKVWGLPLVQGIDHRSLSLGIGHYPSTEMPGQAGNFAIAGHRATNGEPFAYFEKLQKGDSVFVRTASNWFEYQLFEDQIVQEAETWVLADSPRGLDIAEGTPLITLTTCDPRWNSYQRWAWWGVLVKTYPPNAKPTEVIGGN